ncbi:hypothetical protein BDY19DRAFT_348662 [Irpex rosettiformis]|uniref:Uncharacterized protein n=1 Tax=Irpex rosettiformis TaxID=378272 RepID=A0ACB8TX05_9APHY|nr:hypothetical protein BDY19DRAFT_348662 [Irpex rosettiformis]
MEKGTRACSLTESTVSIQDMMELTLPCLHACRYKSHLRMASNNPGRCELMYRVYPLPLYFDVAGISPAQEYPHTHSHHQTLSYEPQNTSHTPAHIANILGYLTPPYEVPRPRQSTATISSVEEYENDSESTSSRPVGAVSERRPEIGAEPSVRFAREIWWDTLIGLYYSRTQSQSPGVQLALNLNQPLSPGLRESLGQQITADLKFLFRASNYWFSFVNVPRFFSRLLDPAQRSSLQPSLILAALACANLIRSSEQEDGKDGRDWALTLLSLAQAALEASTNSRWIDETLVQASWMMVFFEVSAHPAHTGIRVHSALTMLDNLILSLSLSILDSNDERTSRFGSRTVPIVETSSPIPVHNSPRNGSWALPASALLTASSTISSSRSPPNAQTESPTTSLASQSAPPCNCSALTLGQNWRYATDLTPLWLMTPAWHPDASDPEVRKEECRRLVWSAVTLVAGYTSYVASLNVAPQVRLSLMDASNIALLFPGETLLPSLSPSTSPIDHTLTKSTVWALYMRTMLLWHSCLRVRWDSHQSDASKAEFAVGAWLEIDKIEKALNSHNCGVERAFLFQGREYLFNTRMCISYEFRRFIPQATANANMVFHRKKAEEWLTHQAQVAKQTMFGLQSITHQPNVTFARRPFFVFWFMSQVSRALLLWSCDNSLTVALDVSKALIAPIEYLMSIWPCSEQQVRYHNLRVRLDHACLSAGIPPPPPYARNPSHLPSAS